VTALKKKKTIVWAGGEETATAKFLARSASAALKHSGLGLSVDVYSAPIECFTLADPARAGFGTLLPHLDWTGPHFNDAGVLCCVKGGGGREEGTSTHSVFC
jgi:hypothetical protein